MKLTCLKENPGSTTHLQSDAPLVRGITDYCYEGGYSGRGNLIAVDEEGTWYTWECGHCSCYGPLDSPKSGRFTKEEMLKLHPEFSEFINAN